MGRKRPAPDASQEIWDSYNDYKEKHRLEQAQWRLEHPEKIKIIQRKGSAKWRLKNPEKARTVSREGTRRLRVEDIVTARFKGAFWAKQWREQNPENVKMNDLKTRYGLSKRSDYARLVLAQNGCCAICKLGLSLSIDHCHLTNKVRGLLCRNCNTALGMLKDSPELLQSAIEYLKRFK
jgi:hypothetical protein